MTWDSASSEPSVQYAVLVESLLDEPAYFHTGVGALSWDGKSWLGVGHLGSISAVSSGVNIDAAETVITLSGADPDKRSELLNALARGKRVNFYHGFFDDDSGSWALEPELELAGFISSCELIDEIGEDGPSLSVSVGVMDAAAYLRRYGVSNRSDSSHQELFPGDKFFEFRTDVRYLAKKSL